MEKFFSIYIIFFYLHHRHVILLLLWLIEKKNSLPAAKRVDKSNKQVVAHCLFNICTCCWGGMYNKILLGKPLICIWPSWLLFARLSILTTKACSRTWLKIISTSKQFRLFCCIKYWDSILLPFFFFTYSYTFTFSVL